MKNSRGVVALFLAVVGCSSSTSTTTPATTAAGSSDPTSSHDGAEADSAGRARGDQPAPSDVASPPSHAERTQSGVASVVLRQGNGAKKPSREDRVVVHYTGWTKDGKMFDSSLDRGQPFAVALAHVLPGWAEGVTLMTPGERRRIWIPAALAYGDVPRVAGAPAGPLTFDVELLEILPMPQVPEDVASPSATARRTPSGLAYRVLREGAAGGRTPGPTSQVVVDYSGWTADGKLFDSSIVRGERFEARLDQVIPGWTEGMQLMTPGSKFRFWIPASLAYGDEPKHPGAPAGQLTFDVELFEVK